MRGGKRPSSSSRHHGPKTKKRKRSKKFWQQRQTAEMTPAPVPEEEPNHSTSEEDDEDGDKNNYQELLATFSTKQITHKEEESGSESSSDAESATVNQELDGSDVEETGDPESSGEDEEQEEDDQEEEEDDDDDEKEDPFVARLNVEIPDELQTKIKTKENVPKHCVTWNTLGKLSVHRPIWKVQKNAPKKCLLDGDNADETTKHTLLLQQQAHLVNASLNQPMQDFFLSDQLKQNLAVANVKNLKDLSKPLTDLQTETMSILTTYKDFYYSDQSHSNLEQTRLVYVLHALNHVLKTRSAILKNAKRLSKDSSAANVRDQGLCRPKVLIVVPFKESARRVVDLMAKLMFGRVKGGNVANKKRFDEDFGTELKGLGKIKASGHKPDDFYETFCGDTDDGFKLGMAVTKKTLKLYSDFYSSDIIVASPLGLRMVLGVEGEAKRDFDFLASIEVMIMDQMDVLAMQNWDHVRHILDHLHLQPSQSHGVDFSRVRMWSLNGLSKMYRQSILLSSVVMPEVNAILNRDCLNYCGSVRLANACPVGSISSVSTSVPLVFHRFECSSLGSAVDERFDYFVNRVMPEYSKDLMYHTLIFVPSYFDFVRVRNWCNASDLDVAEISEYTKDKKVAMARDMFFHSEKHFLLYSERAHFYRRYAIKGIRHLIFYQLPQNPKFFAELCNFMHWQNKKGGSDGNMSCTVIYCKYDVHRLAPVVSSDRAQTMVSATKGIHMFSPGTKSD